MIGMFLYLGATPILPDIFSKLVEIALTYFMEGLLKSMISQMTYSKEWTIMFDCNSAILLGTAGRLSS